MARRRRKRGVGRGTGERLDIPGSLYPTLDLHGLTAPEATARAKRWLIEQCHAGEAVVRVITGRGMHSIGPPVLPAVITSLLDELKRGTVRRYEVEAGGGVFRVYLTCARVAHEPERAVNRLPPDLVREAEEALAELGVTPTPALIEAEVRRILANRGR